MAENNFHRPWIFPCFTVCWLLQHEAYKFWRPWEVPTNIHLGSRINSLWVQNAERVSVQAPVAPTESPKKQQKVEVKPRRVRPKNFICPWEGCDQTANCKSHLEAHFRTHTGERPFVCPKCRAAFAKNEDMTRHKETVHSDDRKYRCPKCPERFKRSDHLKRHRENIHERASAAATRKPRSQQLQKT